MTIFWILVAGLAGLALLFVLAPLLGDRPADQHADDIDLDEVNLSLFKQQVAELDADLAAGKLDQDQYDSARQDLEREALNNVGGQKVGGATDDGAQASKPGVVLPSARLTAVALLVAVPAATLALYLMLGSQEMIPRLDAGAAGQVATAQGHSGSADGMPPLGELVAKLEQRMQQNPADAEGWMMLGRTYFATGNREQAQSALAKAYELMPADPMIVLAYAESIATNNQNQLEGRPAELISEALELEPNNTTARWLAAMVAFQRGQFRSAATTWRKLLEQLDPDSEDATELRNLINEAEQRAGLPTNANEVAQIAAPGAEAPQQAHSKDEPLPGSASAQPTGTGASAPPPSEQIDSTERSTVPTTTNGTVARSAADGGDPEKTSAEAGSSGIVVQVALAPELDGRLPPNTPVFIYAKAAAGPPMPLAVQRATLGDLPLEVRLDDSMAMMPGMQLSNFPEVIIGARVSPSGQAMPRPGDLQGETDPIADAGAETVRVLVNQVRR